MVHAAHARLATAYMAMITKISTDHDTSSSAKYQLRGLSKELCREDATCSGEPE